MKFSLFGVEVDVELPADPVGFIKGKVIELLNYMGYEWTVTDTGVLDGWADQWDGLQGQMQAYISDLEAGVTHITSQNVGDLPNAVAAYMNGGESNLHSLKTVADAAPLAATAYRGRPS